MKTLALLLVVLSLVITTTPIYASTNPTVLEGVTAAAKQTIATNVNQVMVQILTGVKDASGEIYGVSKVAVAQSYDYVKKETPEIIKEFLLWRLTESCIFTGGWVASACLLFILAYKLKKFSLVAKYREDTDNAIGGKWILSILASLMIIITLAVNGMTIGKILVAPRVYIIEYVVDTIKTHN